MTDIFDTKIICKHCNKEMKPILVNKNGFELRAVQCQTCKDKIIHPADLNGFENYNEHYNDLKGKTFNVKLRMVGNSHAVSIPKEIITFIKEQESMMDDMVRLCFEDFGRLSLHFGQEDIHDAKRREQHRRYR